MTYVTCLRVENLSTTTNTYTYTFITLKDRAQMMINSIIVGRELGFPLPLIEILFSMTLNKGTLTPWHKEKIYNLVNM